MLDDQIHYLDLVTIAQHIGQGDVRPTELVDHMLARIAELEPQLHSYAFVAADNARRQAEEAERSLAHGRPVGPLHGVPIAVKDLFWTADMPTAAGMAIHRSHRPPYDAEVIIRLREAGAIILGKLQMTEGAFALHHPSIPEPRNPWSAAHWPGASSSGSGIATAAGLCFGALGSDTGGSIRFPCAANGLTGLKPSWGRVSRHGTFELAASLDHVGAIARSAADVALLHSVIAGYSGAVPGRRAELSGLRVVFDPAWNANGSDPETLVLIDAAVNCLSQLGATVEAGHLPDARPVYEAWEEAAGMECAVAHAADFPSRGAEYGPALARLIETGRAVPPARAQQILLARMAYRDAIDAVFATADLILLPVLPYAAPSLDRLGSLAHDPEANSRLIQFTSPFNFSGHPAISLPGGFTSAGLPLGFQLVAARDGENLLCSVGMAFQNVTDWHLRRPARPAPAAET